MLAAIFAAVNWLMVFALSNANRTTVATNRIITPTLCFKELASRFLIGKLMKKLES